VEGVAPFCRGLIVPIFPDRGSRAALACSQLDLARGILLAVENEAHVINISGGQLTPSGQPEPMLAQAIERCLKRNVLIVAAVGNDGCECLHLPAAVPSVLAVGAMDHEGNPLILSNWGPAYRNQGILAPGMDVLVAASGGATARKSGTSFAAAFVSGIVGGLLALQIKLGQVPNPQAIRSALLASAEPCPLKSESDCLRFLVGRLNVHGVLKQLLGGDGHMAEFEMLSRAENSSPVAKEMDTRTADGVAPSGAARVAATDRAVQMSESTPNASAAAAPSHARDVSTSVQAAARPAQRITGIIPSDCGCGGGANCTCGAKSVQGPPLVYALGKLGYDFGSQARRDSFVQAMPREANNPFLPDHLLGHLERHPYDASSLLWTLNLDATPIYAIQPAGPFAAHAYERLREFLHAQVHEGVEFVSIPGVIVGSATLQSGQVIPVVSPAVRGMYSWATKQLVEHVLGERPSEGAAQTTYDEHASGLTDFLNRVYFDLRNLGITAEERALNYSATNAVQVRDVVRSATVLELDFDRPVVKKSPVCRPDSDCYDVELLFFKPENTNVAYRIYRFTVDVSDVIPVTVGEVRNYTRKTLMQ